MLALCCADLQVHVVNLLRHAVTHLGRRQLGTGTIIRKPGQHGQLTRNSSGLCG